MCILRETDEKSERGRPYVLDRLHRLQSRKIQMTPSTGERKYEVWLWVCDLDWLTQLILFDGFNTYWSDYMRPSGGYSAKKLRRNFCRITRSKFYKIGEL